MSIDKRLRRRWSRRWQHKLGVLNQMVGLGRAAARSLEQDQVSDKAFLKRRAGVGASGDRPRPGRFGRALEPPPGRWRTLPNVVRLSAQARRWRNVCDVRHRKSQPR